jgi:Holliday junction resolvase-like predicted endonuclease
MSVDHAKNSARKGRVRELAAALWLLDQGYEVFDNMIPNGPIDLVALKDGAALFIDVKTASRSPRVDGSFYLQVSGVTPKKDPGVPVTILAWDTVAESYIWWESANRLSTRSIPEDGTRIDAGGEVA